MNNTFHKPVFIFYPAVAMSLGWALRGTIGGGQMGALIPGAMVALSLAVVLKKQKSAAFLVLCGAAGIAMGGQMTYGQTLGFVLKDETLWKGFFACFTKGATWGLSGSAIIGIALIQERLSKKLIAQMVLVMVAATVIGWHFIDKKSTNIFYLSDPKNPRNEIWFGLLLGAVSLLSYHYIRTKDSFLVRFSLYGLLYGGVGFGVGSTFLYYGPKFGATLLGMGWWSCMELYFGFFYGAGLGIACYNHRHELMNEQKTETEDQSQYRFSFINYAVAMILVFLVCYTNFHVPFLPIFSVLCAVLVIIGMNSNYLSWQLGITLTCMAFIRDSWNYLYLKKGMFMEEYLELGKESLKLPEYQQYEKWGWLVIVILTLLIGAKVSKNFYRGKNSVVSNFILLIWTGVIFLIIKQLYHYPNISGTISKQVVAVGMGIACHYMTKKYYSVE